MLCFDFVCLVVRWGLFIVWKFGCVLSMSSFCFVCRWGELCLCSFCGPSAVEGRDIRWMFDFCLLVGYIECMSSRVG